MRRINRPRNPIQSFKNIVQLAPISRAAATNNGIVLSQGVDNYAGPTANNYEVPTGAVITGFDIQLSQQNLVNVAAFSWVSIQLLRANQVRIDPRAAGGNSQRNQVHLQVMRSIGQNQNVDYHFRFKVPKKFQRVREDDVWILTTQSDQIYTEACQVVYKFYR